MGYGRKYARDMRSTPVDGVEARLGRFDCVLIATDHSAYNYKKNVDGAHLVLDSRNATKAITSERLCAAKKATGAGWLAYVIGA